MLCSAISRWPQYPGPSIVPMWPIPLETSPTFECKAPPILLATPNTSAVSIKVVVCGSKTIYWFRASSFMPFITQLFPFEKVFVLFLPGPSFIWTSVPPYQYTVPFPIVHAFLLAVRFIEFSLKFSRITGTILIPFPSSFSMSRLLNIRPYSWFHILSSIIWNSTPAMNGSYFTCIPCFWYTYLCKNIW